MGFLVHCFGDLETQFPAFLLGLESKALYFSSDKMRKVFSVLQKNLKQVWEYSPLVKNLISITPPLLISAVWHTFISYYVFFPSDSKSTTCSF